MTTNATSGQESDASNRNQQPVSESATESRTHAVYRGERDPARPVGEEVRVSVGGDTLAERREP